MQKLKIYHNPRCSKSRQTLQLIRDHGVEPHIIHYLDTPPTRTELTDILGLLGISAAELLRTGEVEYKDHIQPAKPLDEDELISLMVRYPKVIERPIVLSGERAVVGRPPEAVLTLL